MKETGLGNRSIHLNQGNPEPPIDKAIDQQHAE